MRKSFLCKRWRIAFDGDLIQKLLPGPGQPNFETTTVDGRYISLWHTATAATIPVEVALSGARCFYDNRRSSDVCRKLKTAAIKSECNCAVKRAVSRLIAYISKSLS